MRKRKTEREPKRSPSRTFVPYPHLNLTTKDIEYSFFSFLIKILNIHTVTPSRNLSWPIPSLPPIDRKPLKIRVEKAWLGPVGLATETTRLPRPLGHATLVLCDRPPLQRGLLRLRALRSNLREFSRFSYESPRCPSIIMALIPGVSSATPAPAPRLVRLFFPLGFSGSFLCLISQRIEENNNET